LAALHGGKDFFDANVGGGEDAPADLLHEGMILTAEF
jgi:hypothetical protein